MKVLRFGLVGIVNTVVDYAMLNLLVLVMGVVAPAGVALCNLFSFLGANLNSYFLNKRWTFEDRSRWSRREYVLFLLCSMGGLGINCGLVFAFSHILTGLGWSFWANINTAKLAATAISMVWNFFSYRAFVFGACRPEADPVLGGCGRRSVVCEK